MNARKTDTLMLELTRKQARLYSRRRVLLLKLQSLQLESEDIDRQIVKLITTQHGRRG